VADMWRSGRDKRVADSRSNVSARPPSKNPTPPPSYHTKASRRPRKNKKSMRLMFYRRDGTPYDDVMDWARDFDKGSRHIADVTLPNGVRISTVWLGLDHNHLGKGRPLIFETMVFAHGNYDDLDCWRYSTEEEAIRGHKTLVKKWSARKTIEEIMK